MGKMRRFQLKEPDDGQRHFYLLAEASGPGAGGRSIEQFARPITARHQKFGEIKLTQETFDSFIKNFNDNVYGQDIQGDRNHDPDKGVTFKVERLAKDAQQRFFAEVSWTELGVKTYKKDGFKYLSIDYTDDYVHPETGVHHGPLLFGAALTPRPFIKNMVPSAGPGRMLLSEGRETFVPEHLQLNEGAVMKNWVKKLKAALEAKKLSATVVGILVAQAEHQAEALQLGDDETRLTAFSDSIVAGAGEIGKALAAPAVEPPKQLSEADIADMVGKAFKATLAENALATKTTAETLAANRKVFTDALDGAKGLSDATRELLKGQAEVISASLTADQVKLLADKAIAMGDEMEVRFKRAGIGLPGPAGSLLPVYQSSSIGSQVHGLMRERLMLTDQYGSGDLKAPEEKNLSPFARKVLAAFDHIHGPALEAEAKHLAGNGSTNIADGKFPVVAQRQVIVELLSDLKFLALVQPLLGGDQPTIQIPYELRNVGNIVNGAITYEGQGIRRAGVQQLMDTAFVTPRKIAMMMSNEIIHFSRIAQINWDAWGRNISSNARLMREIISGAIASEMQRASDSFGAIEITNEAITAQVNGTRTLFKTAQFPVVRPRTPRDLQGTAVGTEENPLTLTIAAANRPMYDGTGAQAAGNYFQFTDWNQGLFQIVNQAGVVQTLANATAVVLTKYSYATNVSKFDLDFDDAVTTYDKHLNGLLVLLGRRKAILGQERYVRVNYGICAETLHNTVSEAQQFEANSQKNGTGLDAMGDLGVVKGVPMWGTNQPGVDLGESRILMGERGTTSYGISKPFVTGEPHEMVDANGLATGQKQAYGEEYSTIHTPAPIKGRMTSIIVYSATARAAI